LRKLYEGTSEEVIKHFHSFAVSEAFADKDVQAHGKRNVGVRAKEIVEGYLGLTETLSNLADALGMVATQADIGKLDSAEVEYVGWWTLNDLKPIGRVILLDLSFTDFLSRCKDLFEVIKGLQKPHLLQMVVKLGLKKDQKIGKNGEPIAKLESLRLAATVGQLAHIAIDQGLNLIQDSPHFVDTWDPDVKIREFKALFALNGLRIASAHNVMDQQVDEALNAFGIDKATCHNGWGLALDRVYDEVITALRSASQLIRKSLNI
jgi:hypothetical protein